MCEGLCVCVCGLGLCVGCMKACVGEKLMCECV